MPSHRTLIGAVIYFLYGYHNSKLRAGKSEASGQPRVEVFGE